MTAPCTDTDRREIPTPEAQATRRLGRRALIMLPLVIAGWMALASHGRAQDRAGDRVVGDSRSVESVLSRQGFREVDRVQRRGGLWVAEAIAPEGRRIRAVVDAATGEVTGLRPIDGSIQPLQAPPPRLP
jgi:hypothetical protein